MNTLIDFLTKASNYYYRGVPIISDEVFDRLSESCGYDSIGSAPSGPTGNHLYPMYSLQKYYEDEGNRPLAAHKNLCMSPKLDGAAVSILYVDGFLARVLTRGDGVEGRDVTDKFLATRLIPHEIPVREPVQITGEIAAPNHIENARNYAAGSLNLIDVDEFKTRAVSFFAYGIQPYQKPTYDGDMKVLMEWGFTTVQASGLDQVFPTDGVVFRINDNATFDELGYTSKHPRGSYAQKTRGNCVETTLIGVEWQVGKSGKVTPVGILEPVMVGDAQVSRATLNNPGFIRALGLQIGDTVAIRRAGEIIPEIVHKVE